MVKVQPSETQEERDNVVMMFLENESSCSSYLPSRKRSESDIESRKSHLMSIMDSYAVFTESEVVRTENSKLNGSIYSDDDDK